LIDVDQTFKDMENLDCNDIQYYCDIN
jgi:hypothetical protein